MNRVLCARRQQLRRAAAECVISVDTRKSVVARAAIEAGADIINDASAGLYDPGIYQVAAGGDYKKAGSESMC